MNQPENNAFEIVTFIPLRGGGIGKVIKVLDQRISRCQYLFKHPNGDTIAAQYASMVIKTARIQYGEYDAELLADTFNSNPNNSTGQPRPQNS